MRTWRHIVWAAASLAALFTVSSLLTAGPLTPPAGPVTPTNKTLLEIEPRTAVNAANTPGDDDLTPSLFKITQPGAYYLEDNIAGAEFTHGIEITAGGVTLDLNGFELAGVPGALSGVFVSAVVKNVQIHSGVVRNWGGAGVDAVAATNAVLRDLAATNNGFNGLDAGDNSVISRCVARDNGGAGISASDGAVISGCAARSNSGSGIFAAPGAAVTGCTARFNGASGIFVSTGSTVSACAAISNSGAGIRAGGGCNVSGNSAASNADDGVQAGAGSLVTGNSCNGNGGGVLDGAGIQVTGAGTRVEGNNVTGNDRGIDVADAGNLVVRNSVSGNPIAFNVAPGNTVGPTVTSATIAANTSPHANYAF